MSTLDSLTPQMKSAFFKKLAANSLMDVAMEYGLDKHFATKPAIRNAAYRVYLQVKQDPEKYLITPEVFNLVEESIKTRKVRKGKLALNVEMSAMPTQTLRAINNEDVKSVLVEGRNKAARLLHTKMDYLEAHPKKLNEENIVSLAKVFGIFFDKAQIISGEATENIAVLSKIDDKMLPEEAMKALLQFREKTMEQKFNKETAAA